MLSEHAMNTPAQPKVVSETSYTGKVIGHKRGFGFLEVEGESESIYLPHAIMMRVFNGDVVEICIKKFDNGKTHIELVGILEVEFREMVGHVVYADNQSFIVPDHHRSGHRYYVPRYALGNARHGDYVLFKRVDEVGDQRCKIEVVEVIGKMRSAGFEHRYALLSSGVEVPEYSSRTEEELVDAIEDARYVDMTEIPFVTVDSEFSVDLDDAVWVEEHANGWNVKVAIADPADEVEEGSELDRKAMSQAQTIYMPGMTVPMLSEDIANRACSLMPGVKRKAIVISMGVDATGRVSEYSMSMAMVKSVRKLSYIEVNECIDGWASSAFKERYPESYETIKASYSLHRKINKDVEHDAFSRPEHQIVIDFASKKAIDIKEMQLLTAHKVIETLMVLTNNCATDLVIKEGLPAIFRAHGGLDEAKREEAEFFLQMLYQRPADALNDMGEYLSMVEITKRQELHEHYLKVLNKYLNRSCYTNTVRPHFGLALPAYLTITSPIRKYSDLVNHRVIKAHLEGRTSQPVADDVIEVINSGVGQANKVSSLCEKLFRLQYAGDMLEQGMLNEPLEATIISVDRNGFMCRTDKYGLMGYIYKGQVEGGDMFIYDYALKWADSFSDRFFMGKKIKVVVKSVQRQSQSIEMQLHSTM